MNIAVKKMVRKLNIVSGFRKITAYVLIFSLLWQNSLWAHYGLYTMEEDLEGSRVRTYSGRRAGIVEPGTIRDAEIHNVFEDLQLLEGGGLVFTGAPNTTKIYNRIYNAAPIQLSGVIETDYPLPMVFANPGGIVLENPDFQNIHNLTLAAGSLAQTNEGMAYGIDEGSLIINKTFIQEANDVKNLSLAGRGILVKQSFLSPSESLILRTGQHIKGWNKKGEWVNEDYVEDNDSPLLGHSIVLEDSTILRSKGLFFESLDPGASIHAKGLLHSTEGDIVIHARGDVYLNQLCAHRNLNIETTGKVFLGNQILFGGSVNIKAAEIINQGKLIGTGKITFDAPWSQNKGFIKTHSLFDAKGFLNGVQGRVEAKSVADPLSLLSHNLGSVELQDDLKFTASGEIVKGTIKTHGKFEVGGNQLTLDGNICAQNGFDFKDLKKLTNKRGSSISAVKGGFQGTLTALENDGKIDLPLSNGTIGKLTNTGLFSAMGGGLQGSITELDNKGKMDFSSVNAKIGRSMNHETGIIRTRGHSILQGDHHTNKGKIFTCGVHQTILTGTYKNSGTFYSPSLFLLNARDIEYIAGHKSMFKDGVIRASSRLRAGEDVSFELYGNNNTCFLQLNSEANLNYNGKIRLFCSSQLPILEYFKLFKQTPISHEEFRKEIDLLPLGPWKEMRRSLGSGITLQASQNINCENATIDPENGSVNFFTNGQFYTNNAKIKAGYFKGDNAAIQSKTAVLNHTKLSSLFGSTSIVAKESAALNCSTIDGRLSASIDAPNIEMDRSKARSGHGTVTVHGAEDGLVNIKKSSIDAKSNASVRGGDIKFDSSKMKAREGTAQVQAIKSMSVNNSSIKADSTVSLIADYIDFHSSTLTSKKGGAHLQATKSLHSKNSQIFSQLLASVSGEDVSFHSSKLTSQIDKASIEATKSAKITGSAILGQFLTSVMGEDIKFDSSTLNSQKGASHLQATKSATIKYADIRGQLLAFVGADDVSFDSSTLTSREDKAQIAAKNAAKISASIILARSLSSVIGSDVSFHSSTLGSQEDVAMIAATQLANIVQSTLRGKTTAIDGGKNLTLSHSKLEGKHNHCTAKNINATSNKTNGKTVFDAKDKLQVHGLKSIGEVTALAPKINLSGDIKAASLQAQGKHIKVDGSVFVEKFLSIIGKTVEQHGTTKAGGNSYIEASKCYSGEGRNEAGKNLSLIAEETTGFKGYQKAGDTLEIKLKDMNLFDLLNRTEARITKAHLREAEVKFNEDFILDRTLHLWGKSLENKAKFTASKDFIANMQTLIMNEGSMLVQGNMSLESQGTIANFGLMEAGKDLTVKGKEVHLESRVERETTPGGYRDELTKESALVAREGNLKVEAAELLQARGAKFEAKLNVNLKSAGALYLGAQQLSSEFTTADSRSFYHRYSLNHLKSQVNAGQNVNIFSGEGMLFEGLDVKAAGYIHAKSEGTFENRTVHDILQEESRRISKGGFLKGKKVESSETTAGTVVRNTFVAGGYVIFESEGDNIQQVPRIESGGDTSIISHKGKVLIKADKSSYMTSSQSSSKSAVWQSQQQKGRYDETVEMLEILANGGIHISGAQGIEAEIKGGQSETHAIDLLEEHKETAWVKELRKNPKATWHKIAEEHKAWNQKTQGLTPAATAVIVLAISIVTAGTGAAAAGFAAASMQGAMASAAFTTLVTQASLSLINNQGNIGKVLKEMGSKENLRSLATSVVSAGISQGIPDQLGLLSQAEAKTFAQYLQKNAVNSGTSAGLSMLIQKQDLKDTLLQAAKGIAVSTISGAMANKIGIAYGEGDLNWTMHKLAHGALGAFTGAVLGDNPKAGALAGALGGIASEIIADSMKNGAAEKAYSQALDQAKKEGQDFYKNLHAALSDEVNKIASIGRIGAALSAFALNQDVHIATSTAANALDNNFVPMVMLGVASALCSGYDVYGAYEKDGAEGALKELAKQGIGIAAGGAIAKVGGPAAAATLKAILDKNPMLAMVFSKTSDQVNKVVETVVSSKVGQAAFKIKETGEKIVGKGVINPSPLNSQTPVNKILLQKQLASEQQLNEIGTIIAGKGTKKVFVDEPRIVAQYGGQIGEWVKKSSTQAQTHNGIKFEIHWVESLITGKRIEQKTKFIF